MRQIVLIMLLGGLGWLITGGYNGVAQELPDLGVDIPPPELVPGAQQNAISYAPVTNQPQSSQKTPPGSGFDGKPSFSNPPQQVVADPQFSNQWQPASPNMRLRTKAHVVTTQAFEPIPEEELARAEQVRHLKDQLRNEQSEDARKQLGEQLQNILQKIFNDDVQRRDAELQQLETRIKALRADVERRKSARDRIIQLQIETLMLEAEGLTFPLPGDEAMVRARSGTAQTSTRPQQFDPYGLPETDAANDSSEQALNLAMLKAKQYLVRGSLDQARKSYESAWRAALRVIRQRPDAARRLIQRISGPAEEYRKLQIRSGLDWKTKDFVRLIKVIKALNEAAAEKNPFDDGDRFGDYGSGEILDDPFEVDNSDEVMDDPDSADGLFDDDAGFADDGLFD